jgi:hypothetical protein
MPTWSYWFILNYSIYRRVNWVIQCITNIYPSLYVTYTIMSKCCHTLFSSVLVALFYTFVNPFTWVISKLYPCLSQESCHISLSSQDHKYIKMLHQPLSIVCTAWFCLLGNNVFMLCYSCCYRLKVENVYSREKQKSLNFKKASDTHASPPILLMH